jgi:hypothetical protein
MQVEQLNTEQLFMSLLHENGLLCTQKKNSETTTAMQTMPASYLATLATCRESIRQHKPTDQLIVDRHSFPHEFP